MAVLDAVQRQFQHTVLATLECTPGGQVCCRPSRCVNIVCIMTLSRCIGTPTWVVSNRPRRRMRMPWTAMLHATIPPCSNVRRISYFLGAARPALLASPWHRPPASVRHCFHPFHRVNSVLPMALSRCIGAGECRGKTILHATILPYGPRHAST
eukprot:9095105-Prorocentrum_lima.AAC.1